MFSLEICDMICLFFYFFYQAEDGIRYYKVTGVQTCALPIYLGVAEIQRRDSSGPAKGDSGGPQDRGNYKNPSRCGDCVCEAAIHSGNSGARADRKEG